MKYQDECIQVLAEGERLLEELQLQEKSFVALVSDAQAERFCPVEDMPGLIPAELTVRMEDRQADVQEALLQREPNGWSR